MHTHAKHAPLSLSPPTTNHHPPPRQYLQASGSAPKLSAKDLGSKWGVSLRAALLHRYGVTAQDLVDVRVRSVLWIYAGVVNPLCAWEDRPIHVCVRTDIHTHDHQRPTTY